MGKKPLRAAFISPYEWPAFITNRIKSAEVTSMVASVTRDSQNSPCEPEAPGPPRHFQRCRALISPPRPAPNQAVIKNVKTMQIWPPAPPLNGEGAAGS